MSSLPASKTLTETFPTTSDAIRGNFKQNEATKTHQDRSRSIERLGVKPPTTSNRLVRCRRARERGKVEGEFLFCTSWEEYKTGRTRNDGNY